MHFIVRESCPACRSTGKRRLYSGKLTEPPISEYLESFYTARGGIDLSYLEGGTYTLIECDTCGLVYQEEILDDRGMELLYEIWANPNRTDENPHSNVGFEAYVSHAREIMQMIAYFGKKPSELAFFDFGMGWGRWAIMANAFGCDTSGAELSESRIEHARANGITIIDWEDIPRHSFDFINTEEVFEHLTTPVETLEHLTKALKPGDILKICAPNGRDVSKRIHKMDWRAPRESDLSFSPVAPLEHINCYNREPLVNMGRIAGLEEVTLPLSCQYRFMTDWNGIKKSIKNILRPVYYRINKSRTYILFRRRR